LFNLTLTSVKLTVLIQKISLSSQVLSISSLHSKEQSPLVPKLNTIGLPSTLLFFSVSKISFIPQAVRDTLPSKYPLGNLLYRLLTAPRSTESPIPTTGKLVTISSSLLSSSSRVCNFFCQLSSSSFNLTM